MSSGRSRVTKKTDIRLITIGDSATGKSSLITRYTKGTFTEDRKATVGIDLRIRSCVVDGRGIKVKIWDTAGQEQFRTITKNYYRGAQGVVLVYDITNKDSFQHVHRWIKDVQSYGEEGVEMVIVGNKVDLDHDKRQVSKAQGRAVADNFNCAFFETSALSGVGVEDAFESLVRLAVSKLPAADDVEQKNDNKADLSTAKTTKKNGCCK
mmetsp:Transcript_23846/g.42252  ORF Transcript_23846/g.42252 Transcript_23846/m.42252 type:complete len:209 (-) Transcript_23846:139-765(-)|eukprot:CAMPEP_0197515814 /NCGR_PEP_ID=MMETSP1318-20131121/821_1 /TAXON_ID=552666 /ORGANISM="Partenskyella glossopodia, Strain RCC365" /LENGTH=208 /DNA_ID=CAMNT_0043064277 /DNA_START=338 /DNA_END=964 /DNA_ORIENTATION=-